MIKTIRFSWKWNLAIQKNNEGTTLLETMFAVLLFSLISSIIALFLFNSYKNISGFRERIDGESRLMLFRRITASEISRINQPYWAIPADCKYLNNIIFIPWYNGTHESFIEISNQDDGVIINSPAGSYCFRELSIISVDHINNEHNNILEISLLFRNEIIPMRFRFSGFGLSSK